MLEQLPKGGNKRSSTHLISVIAELKSTPKKNGCHALFLRITENRKIRRVYLGYDIPVKDWNEEKKQVRRSHPLHQQINNTIQKKTAEVATIRSEVKNANAAIIADSLKGKSSEFFFPYAYAYANRQAYNTTRNITTEINKFKEFAKNDSLLFSEITVPLLNSYQHWLQTKRKNNLTTVHMGLGKIRSIINRAIREGIVPVAENPFLLFKLEEGRPERVRLTEEELQAFIEVELPEGSLLWNTRNYWLFAYYGAGIRFSDVACLKWSNITAGRLSYLMRKTKHRTLEKHSIPLPKQAAAILDAYQNPDSKPQDYLFPILNPNRKYETEEDLLKEVSRKNALINKYLKMICDKAKIPKELSFHSARHTFADHARRKTNDVYAVSKLLRHSKISITDKYLSSFDTETQDNAMKNIFGE